MHQQIPVEDYESVFAEAVWEAALGYNGKSHFMQRLHVFWERKAIDLYRYYSRDKRNFFSGFIDDLDKYGRLQINDGLPIEEELSGEDLKKRMLAGFETTNERYGKVIRLLDFGCSNHEIGVAFGANGYNAMTRKLVSRAKKNFSKYAATYLAEAV